MASTKVILTQDIENLGFDGQEVRVAAGYYRNYLAPRKMAVLADSANAKWIEKQKEKARKRMLAEKERAQEQAGAMAKLELTAEAKCGENGRLFGSITTQNIVDLLAKNGFEVDRRKIQVDDQIKRIGKYNVVVRLFQDVEARFALQVVGENGLTQADLDARKSAEGDDVEEAAAEEATPKAEAAADDKTEEAKAEESADEAAEEKAAQ